MFRKAAVAVVLSGAFALMGAPVASAQAPMTNQGVIELVKAGMSEDVVLSAIRGSTPKFDTSASGLVALKKAGATDAMIQAMISANSAGKPAAASSGGAPSGNTVNPEEVTVINNGQRIGMKYLVPQMRTAARALGYGGVAQYAALQGTVATLRLSPTPTFEIAVPNNSQPQSYFTLASFAVRKNNTREVMTGGGYMSFSSGINKDRIIAIDFEPAADQTRAPANSTIYAIKPKAPLVPGEYAVVVYSSQVRSVGWFSTGADSYFDFGVD